ncbi:unnamed protein product [Phytophthora fragariaefolia]|uniref:Unnamed protein product n=1 Tax=Phytophthora fragariaefolia TaxID=1490495 RepID=A0A9W6Y9Y0_9STRA|nr:unnamed protein product [Phytophthora fragariaefolia]
MDGIPVDLLFVSLELDSVPEDIDILDDRSKHFLRVQITANNAEDFDGWFGWVESRLRHLFLRYTKDANPEGSSKCEVHTSWLFIGLGFPAPNPVATGETHDVDLTSVIRDFAYYTDQWEARHGGMDMQIDHVTRSEIPEWILDSVDDGACDAKHLRKKSLTTNSSKKKKRDECNGTPNGVDRTIAAGSPIRNSSKKTKGT